MVLTLSEPNAEQWWVANAQNTIRWTGSQHAEFSVYITHPDPLILSKKVALMTHQPLYLYYKMITPIGFLPASGYVLELTNVADSSDIYATSEPFDIKPPGSRRSPPPPLARPHPQTRTSNFSTSSVASTSVSASRTSDGHTTHLTFEYGGAYVAGVHAAGRLCEGFKEISLKEVEEGTGDGWIRLDAPAATRPRRGGKFLIGRASSVAGSSRPASMYSEPMPSLVEALVESAPRGTAEPVAEAIPPTPRETLPCAVEAVVEPGEDVPGCAAEVIPAVA